MLEINSAYLLPKNIIKIKKHMEKRGMVRLEYFLTQESFDKLKKEAQKLDFYRKKQPNQFSYSMSAATANIEMLKKFSSNFLKIRNWQIKKFQRRDYTLLNDKYKSKNKALFFICENWNSKAGGNFIVRKNNSSFVFPPKPNTLLLIKNLEHNFIQYINHKAKTKSFIIVEGIL